MTKCSLLLTVAVFLVAVLANLGQTMTPEGCEGVDLTVERFLYHPEDQEREEGEHAIFTCFYNPYNPQSIGRFFVWEFYQHGGRRFTIRDNLTLPYDYSIGIQGQLIVHNLRINHTGLYQCHATPTVTCDIFSDNATLTVIGRPMVTVSNDHICQNSSGVAVIQGTVLGYPRANVYFYQMTETGMTLVVNSRVDITLPTDESVRFNITFSDLLTADGGNYIVQANNSVGSSPVQSIILIVKGPDRPIVTLQSPPYLIQALNTQVPEMRCSVQNSASTNDDQVIMSWVDKNDNLLSSNVGYTELSYFLDLFQSSMIGEYRCLASNSRGRGEVVVRVYVPINLTSAPTVTFIGNKNFRIQWTPPTPPRNIPIYEYVVYIDRDGQNELTERTSDPFYMFNTSNFQPGEYYVSVSIVLGNQESASTGEGNRTTLSSPIVVADISPVKPSPSPRLLTSTTYPAETSTPCGPTVDDGENTSSAATQYSVIQLQLLLFISTLVFLLNHDIITVFS